MKRKATIIGGAVGALGTLGAVTWALAKYTAQHAREKVEEIRLQQREIEVLEGEGGIVLGLGGRAPASLH